MQEVYIERNEFLRIHGIGRRHHTDGQSLIVEALSGTHLHSQCGRYARNHCHGHAASGQSLSVDADLSAVGVSLVYSKQLQDGQTFGSLGLLALVREDNSELGCIVDANTAHALLVETNLRVHNLQCALVNHRAGAVELRHALILPRILSRTATGAINEAARAIHLKLSATHTASQPFEIFC